MLCDVITEANYLRQEFPGFEDIQKMIAVARKFVLAPDIAAAADGLMVNRTQLKRIIPFCRLPFPFCWFELAQADRPHFMASQVDYPAYQTKPRRIGFLCVSYRDDTLWHWFTTLCWSLRDSRTNFEANASLLGVEFNTKDQINDPAANNLGEFGKYIRPTVARFCPPGYLHNIEKLQELNASDWGGEVHYLFAVLGLLNSRNVAEHHEVDNAAFNKKRAKHNKPPLSSHTLLKIRALHRHSFSRPGRPPSSSDEIRKHFVVGHWKTRKTGLFWWNPYMRGKHGLITHNYLLTE
jgi:hypothetical protein